jgi:hypothetical protein
MKKIISGKQYDTNIARLIGGAGYTDPDEFERWIKTVSRGQWTEEQTFPPNRARRGIWRKKT